MLWRVLLALAAALATGLILIYARGFFPQHALLVALAVGALTYSGWGTVARLWRLWRR